MGDTIQGEGYALHVGECAQVMREYIADESINLTVTSPPYDNLRTYNGFTFDFEPIADELYRVTKPGGVVVWVVADATVNGSETGTSFRQALYFKRIGFRLFDTMIWRKTNPTPTDPRIGRYTPSFEYMFVFSKGRPKPHKMLRTECKTAGSERSASLSASQRKVDGTFRLDRARIRAGARTKKTKILDNVWDFAICADSDSASHPGSFPEALARDHILSWSNPGDIVLDPFVGSGTTGKMALTHGRHFIGIDISAEYVHDIAAPRLAAVQPQLLEVVPA